MRKSFLFFGTLLGVLLLVSCSGGSKKQATVEVNTEELDNASKVINYYHTSLSVLKHVANPKDINAVLGYMEQTGKVPEVSIDPTLARTLLWEWVALVCVALTLLGMSICVITAAVATNRYIRASYDEMFLK